MEKEKSAAEVYWEMRGRPDKLKEAYEAWMRFVWEARLKGK